jgi:cytoskeleton protein RodZ
MDNINQSKGNNDKFSGDETSVGLPKTEQEDANDLTVNQGISLSEQDAVSSTSTKQTADSGTFLIGQSSKDIEQLTMNSNEGVNINFDHKMIENGLNDIDSASIVQSVGHILRKARIAKGMSIDDVSRQLRISIQQVEWIEREDFEKLPGRTFLRGFVRNYANLMQLDSIPLLQMLPTPAPVISTYERTPFRNKQISFASSRENSGNNRLIIVIASLLITTLGVYFFSGTDNWNKKPDNLINSETSVVTDKASIEIQLPLSSAVQNTTNVQLDKASEKNTQIIFEKNIRTESDAKTEILAIPAENKPDIEKIQESAAVSSDMGNLHFTFIADSWVKVTDGKNVTILEQIRKGGSEQTITGKRPLSIVLGNAPGVNLTYNDKEIDIASYKRKDGTARFTLE